MNQSKKKAERKKNQNKEQMGQIENKMIDLNLTTSPTMLNVKVLMIPIKNQRCQIMGEKKDKKAISTTCSL